jgi:hypothetical protein
MNNLKNHFIKKYFVKFEKKKKTIYLFSDV